MLIFYVNKLNKMKRLIITIILSIFFTLTSFSQYSASQYYATQGEVQTQVTYRQEYNMRYNRFETVRYCRQTIWKQDYYTGDVYYYHNYYKTWYTQRQSGYFWYFYWSDWYRC